jgi:acetyltransferase-like isoleucine patch superfamily enzyme
MEKMEIYRKWEYKQILDEKTPPPDMRKSYEHWTFPDVYADDITAYGWKAVGLDPEHPERLALGLRCDIGDFTVLYAHAGIIIEPYVQVGPLCAIMSRSTIDNKEGLVTLKRNCRIGAQSTIMPGVTVGENCIIGAGSFVNKDMPANTICIQTRMEWRYK